MFRVLDSQSDAAIWRLIQRFLPELYPVRWRIVATGILMLVSPLLSIVLLWLMKMLVDDVFVAGRFDLLSIIATSYAGLIAAKLLLDFCLTRVEAQISEQIDQNIRVKLYRHLISVSPGSLRKYTVGDFIAHLSGDAARIELLIYSLPMRTMINAISAAYYICFLLFLSWQLTLAALLTVPALALLSWRFSPQARRIARISRRKTTAWFSRAEERLHATAAIQAFGAEDIEANAFEKLVSTARVTQLKSVALQASFTLLIETVAAIGGMMVLIIGAGEIHSGYITVGGLLAFLGSVGSLYSPITSLTKSASRLQRAAAGAQRVVALLATPSLVTESPGAKPLTGIRGNLTFSDVCFSYPDGPNVLNDVSFTIAPGETVALVGPNGSGKSTLVQLVLRLYDPTAGSISIDGIDLRDATLSSLRQSIAAVFQDANLFRGSIGENIRYGNPAVSEQQFERTAQAARVDAFAHNARQGYGSPIGPHGSWLSGGQRQRLALARALVRDAPILLLDEAMASIDSEAEELIHEAVERFRGSRTILMVSHRFSTASRADRIVVLDQGRLVESGSPETLQRTCNSRFNAFFADQILTPISAINKIAP
jgi:ABC-type multidrug transport system fused ATPase/permease subunit